MKSDSIATDMSQFTFIVWFFKGRIHIFPPMYCGKDIDPSILFDAACGDLDVVANLLELFFDLTGQEMDRLVAAVAVGDAKAVAEVVHKIVGSSAACGLLGLASGLRELEQECKQGLPGDMDERIRGIKDQLESAHVFLKIKLKRVC